MDVKSFLSSSLNSSQVKGLERLADWFRGNTYIIRWSLHCTQGAYQEGKLTKIALRELMTAIEKVISKKNYASVIWKVPSIMPRLRDS